MKNFFLILFFVLISVITFAQKNETNLIVSPAMTFGNISESHEYQYDTKPVFGISFAIQELYNITEKFAIGTELNYSNNNFKLRKGLYTGDWGFYYESIVNVQSFNLPLILRYKTKKKWIIQTEYGLSYALDSKLKVTSVSINLDDNIKEQTPIDKKSNDIKGSFNNYYSAAFGKGFTIGKCEAMFQIYFAHTLRDYYFSHGTSDSNDSNNKYKYSVNPNLIGLRLGIKL